MALAEFTSNGWRDFNQRYVETYGWYTSKDKEILVRVESATESVATFVDADGIQYSANADKGVKFKFVPLNRTLFQYKTGVVLVERKPARQYKRGICLQNTRIRSIVAATNSQLDFELINAYINPKYPVVSERYTLINKSFCLVDGRYIYLYNMIIGHYSPFTNTYSLIYPMFRQEFCDAVRDAGLPPMEYV